MALRDTGYDSEYRRITGWPRFDDHLIEYRLSGSLYNNDRSGMLPHGMWLCPYVGLGKPPKHTYDKRLLQVWVARHRSRGHYASKTYVHGCRWDCDPRPGSTG